MLQTIKPTSPGNDGSSLGNTLVNGAKNITDMPHYYYYYYIIVYM